MLAQAEAGAAFDWNGLRRQISDELDRAETSEDRSVLLGLWTAVMDEVERRLRDSGQSDPLAEFCGARDKEYKIFIVQESLVCGDICAETLYAITQREMVAGRMKPHHGLRQFAIVQIARATGHSGRSMKDGRAY
jgi:hypothetical protein